MKLLLLLAFTATLLADGNGILVQRDSGPWRLTVFANPLPLRAGPAEFAVLVEAKETSAPVPNARVRMTISSGNGEQTTLEPERSQRFLYRFFWDVPAAGQYRMMTSIERERVRAGIAAEVTVLNAAGPIVRFIPVIAIVPIGIGVFAFNRVLRSRQTGQGGGNEFSELAAEDWK